MDDQETSNALFTRAIEERDRSGARYFVLRGVENPDELPAPPALVRPTIRRTVDTSTGSEQLFAALDRRVRREIGRAEAAGYHVFRDPDQSSIDSTFYDVYAEHVHELGTPVMSRKFMAAMRTYLGPRLRVYLIARDTPAIVGGIAGILSAAGFSGWYGVVRRENMADFATYLLYWRIIEDLSRSEIPAFDLGRSGVESGSYQFKRKWPGLDREVAHAFFPRPGVNVDSEANLYGEPSLRQRVWAHLPLGVANTLGPILRRPLPFG